MLKNISSRGFLYHPDTHSILLQQHNPTNTESPWSLLAFSKLEFLKAKIHSVYDYFNEPTGENTSVSYVEVQELSDFPQEDNTIFAWFSHKEISKLKNISLQTKQDLTVGQRVIDSEARKVSGQQTIG